jgi:asparagine synthase (glutamine-hydrolysing)
MWTSPDRRVALGHRRLAIIDLSPGGHQPMTDADGRLHIIFNGEIYNYLELKAELAGLGHTFRTQSDTEVILAGYSQWGLDSVKRLNGMFALALYDRDREWVFLARDRAGEKPLFYRHASGRFAFASELKALMADPSFPRSMDPHALNQYLAFGYVTGDACLFRGVRKLPQGHAMTYDLRRDEVKTWPYWTLPEPFQSNGHPPREEELLDELERLLADSVRMRLIADVPVGIMLSGGVDSSLVTAMAARVSSTPVRTFTISFPGHGAFDESPYARMVAEHFGTRHVELAAEAATVDLLPELARQYDEPLADSSMVPTYLVSRLIRKEATVALGGDGGDELFGGYLHYDWVRRQDLLRRFMPAPLRAAVSACAHALPVGVRGRNYLIGSNRDIGWSLAHANIFFDVGARRKLLAATGVRVDDAPERDKGRLGIGHSAVQRAMAMDFRSYLVDDILVKVDRASMLTSLEVRAPLLDHRIIELAYGNTPDQLRAWKGQRKVLLRKLARRVLPPALDTSRKQGFGLPLHAWFKGNWGRYMRDVLRQSDFFDQGVVKRMITAQEHGLQNAHRLYALTIFELWRREYKVTL